MTALELTIPFALGLAESDIGTRITKSIADDEVLKTEALTFVSLMLWFYVVDKYAFNMGEHIPEVASYILGAMAGNLTAMRGRQIMEYLGRSNFNQIGEDEKWVI